MYMYHCILPPQLDAARGPQDHITPLPNVVNVGPQLFHKQPNPLTVRPCMSTYYLYIMGELCM